MIDDPLPAPVAHGMIGHDLASVAHDDAAGEDDDVWVLHASPDGDTGSDGYVSTYANAYPYAYTSANGNSCTNKYSGHK